MMNGGKAARMIAQSKNRTVKVAGYTKNQQL